MLVDLECLKYTFKQQQMKKESFKYFSSWNGLYINPTGVLSFFRNLHKPGVALVEGEPNEYSLDFCSAPDPVHEWKGEGRSRVRWTNGRLKGEAGSGGRMEVEGRSRVPLPLLVFFGERKKLSLLSI